MQTTLDVHSWQVQLLYSNDRGDQPFVEIEICQGTGQTQYRFVIPLDEAEKMSEHILSCIACAGERTVH